MKLLNLFLALLVCANFYAQEELPVIEKGSIGCGMIYPFGFPVIGTEYVFKDVIENMTVDSLSKTASIYTKTRGTKGELILFDLATEKARWSIPFDNNKVSFAQYGSVLIRTENRSAKTSRINLETGAVSWENGYLPIYVNTSNTIALCYNKFDSETGAFRALHGIDLQTGKSLWWRDVTYENGWNDMYAVNDSTVIINSKGLHCINLKNGNGWNQELPMESTTKNQIEDKIGLTATLALVPYYIREMNVSVNGVCSNILVVDSLVYLAAVKGLYCYRLIDGELIWLAPLRQEFMSNSIISVNEGRINLCNTGYAFRNNQRYLTGKPFMASFNPINGKEHFVILMNHSSEVYDVRIDSNSNKTYLLYHDKVVGYSNATGRVSGSIKFDMSLKYTPDRFLELDLYELDTANYVTFHRLKDSQILTYVPDNEDLIVINPDLMHSKTLQAMSCYWMSLENASYKILGNEQEVILCNTDGNRIANLYVGQQSILHDNLLYDFNGNSILKIDLSSIGKN